MKHIFTFLFLFCLSFLSAQTVVDFEEFNLSTESFLNGSDGSGGFTSGDIFLPNSFNPDFNSWGGWAISNTTDVTTPGFMNQYSAITGGGVDGSATYAVNFSFGNNNMVLQGDAAGQPVPGIYITNGTYPYLSMLEGDNFAKKFGGVTGDDPDFFLLTIKAFSGDTLSADSVNFYLADYRFEDNSQDYIVDEWTWVDLSSLGAADSLSFSLTTTDVGMFGNNTPGYFCVDNVFATAPATSTASIYVPDLIKVYPNPTADFIQIMHSEPKLMEFSLFDTYGRLVQRQIIDSNGIEVDLQALPAGIYTVSVRGERVYSTKRVVKQ